MSQHPPSPDAVPDSAAMAPLHDPSRHEALRAARWDEAAVRAAIARIAGDLEAQAGQGLPWPLVRPHPRDLDGDAPADGFKSLYLGSAGVWWALWWLQRAGLACPSGDPREAIRRSAEAWRAAPDTGERVPSLFLGEVGIELLRWHATGAADGLDALEALVRANARNPTLEGLWGAPGTMWAAWHLARATGLDRWREAWLDSAEDLWDHWSWHADPGCHLWTQDLYGRQVVYLGAGHGWAGTVHALLAGQAWLADERRSTLLARAAQALSATACRDAEAANWPPSTLAPRPGRPRMLVQWCHGAPGIVTALAGRFPVGHDATVDALLEAAGEAVWRAGPLAKGAGLCHGTAGNGWALLMLHRRTGRAAWLERARAFAGHALAQAEATRQAHGRGWPSLWTGDAGVAMFAAQCLDGTPWMDGLPGLDGL